MIEINLLPPELKKKRQKIALFKMPDMQKFTGIPLPIIISGFFGFMVIVQLLVFGMVVIANKRFEVFQKNNETIMPQVNEVRKLKSQLNVMTNRVKAIDEIVEKRLNWAKKLNDLVYSVPSGVWLTTLYYDEIFTEGNGTASKEARVRARRAQKRSPKSKRQKKNPVKVLRFLSLTGHAYSKFEDPTASITKFVENLRANAGFAEDFSEIELGGPIQEAKVEDIETMSFKINCLFKRDVR